MSYSYQISVDQHTNEVLAQILSAEGTIEGEHRTSSYKKAVMWVAKWLPEFDPEGPCRMTRKLVYNYRVWGTPGYWELRTYNAKGEEIDKGQFRDIMPESYLSHLVEGQMGFPLEAAEEIQ